MSFKTFLTHIAAATLAVTAIVGTLAFVTHPEFPRAGVPGAPTPAVAPVTPAKADPAPTPLPSAAAATVLLPAGVQTALDQLTEDLEVFTTSYGSLQLDTATLALMQQTVNSDETATNAAQTAVASDETALAAAIAAAFGGGPPPAPAPAPPAPAPVTPSNLRVLFTYDALGLISMPPEQKAILTSPLVRDYLDKHCPLESCCPTGTCPLKAGRSASYRFLPVNADTSKLAPVWQTVVKAAAGKTCWLIAVNESGKTVIDQAWPASVAETLGLLAKYGGP